MLKRRSDAIYLTEMGAFIARRIMKDILFGTTGPRGGKKDGVVQTMAKSAARQVTNQIVRGMLGSLLGGRRR